jgi:hypothetical protein
MAMTISWDRDASQVELDKYRYLLLASTLIKRLLDHV